MRKYFVYYARHIWRAVIKTWQEYFWDWRGWLGSLVTAIFTVFYLYLEGKVEIMKDEIAVWSAVIKANISWLGILYSFNFLKGIVDEHFYLLPRANKYTWNDIKLIPFAYSETSPFGFGIRVENLKPYDMQYTSGKLIRLMDTVSKNNVNIFDNHNKLPWEKRNNSLTWQSKKLNRETGWRNLVILRWNDNACWFLTNTNPENNQVDSKEENKPENRRLSEVDYRTHLPVNVGDFAFEIEFSTQIDGHRLDPYVFRGRFNMNQNGNLEIYEEGKRKKVIRRV